VSTFLTTNRAWSPNLIFVINNQRRRLFHHAYNSRINRFKLQKTQLVA